MARVSSQKAVWPPYDSFMASRCQRSEGSRKLFGSPERVSWVRALCDTDERLMDRQVEGTDDSCAGHAARQSRHKFLSKPFIAEPGTACTESYIVARPLRHRRRGRKRYAAYLRTRFARFLVSLRKVHPRRDAECLRFRARPAAGPSNGQTQMLYKRVRTDRRRDRFHRDLRSPSTIASCSMRSYADDRR